MERLNVGSNEINIMMIAVVGVDDVAKAEALHAQCEAMHAQLCASSVNVVLHCCVLSSVEIGLSLKF